MKQWSIAVVAAAFGLACTCAQAVEPVPVEAFAEADRITSPRISLDGRHVAVSANLGQGNHAIVVYRVDGVQQTALLKRRFRQHRRGGVECRAATLRGHDRERPADSDTASTTYGRSYIARVLGNDKAQLRVNSPLHLAARITAPASGKGDRGQE